MSDTQLLQHRILEHFFRATAQTSPAEVRVSLWNGDPEGAGVEVSAADYARQVVPFGAPDGDDVLNSAEVDFGVTEAAWGDVTHYALHDGSDMLTAAPLDTAVTVATGDQVRFAAGALGTLSADLAPMVDPRLHAIGGDSHSASTLAELNDKVSDATLDDAAATRTPKSHGNEAHDTAFAADADLDAHTSDISNPHSVTASQVGAPTQAEFDDHSARHEDGGLDEINVAGLSGELADPQPPKGHALGGAAHSADTLAALNALISDATLDDASNPRPHDGSDVDLGTNDIISHGERTLVFPASMATPIDGQPGDNNYFPTLPFTGKRGFLASMSTGDRSYDIPLTPLLRAGDRIKQMEIYYRDASPEDVDFGLMRMEEHGGRTVINSETDAGGGPSDTSKTWGPGSDGLPFTVLNDAIHFAFTLHQTDTFDESRFYMVKVTYDRP